MTSKQHDFIVRLADEKDVASLSEAQRAFLPRVVDGTADLTPAQASRIIEALLALPRKAVADTSTPDVPAGRYASSTPPRASPSSSRWIAPRTGSGRATSS